MIKSINPKTKIILAMITWGTLGLFVRNISLGSIEIAFFRAFIASIFLGLIVLINKEKVDKKALKENAFFLCLSGIGLGVNWAALFQAMKYTTIANATLSYYLGPIFIIIFSSIFLKEKINIKNLVCIFISILGLILILKSGEGESLNNYNHARGIMFGLFGAVLYGIIVISNKFIKNLSSLEITLSQLAISALVLLPIVFSKGLGNLQGLASKTWFLILILGIVHTGLAYLFYFPSIQEVKSQTIAIVSYLDPITAIFISAIFLKEPMTGIQFLGGALILISAFINEKKDWKFNKLALLNKK